MEPLELLSFDEKQIFNNCSLSGNNHSTVYGSLDEAIENERNAYQQQIQQLQEEVAFLRKLLDQ